MTTVVDRPEESRFVVTAGDDEAELTYRLEGDRLVLLHTGVPEAFRGQGVGGRLVRAAAERAARDGLTVAPWCSYARTWLDEHPDVADGLTIDRSPPPRP